MKTLVLVTGGNSGIGFELVAQLMAKGSYHVYLGSRSIGKGETALRDLQSRDYPGTAELVQLDVTSDDSINAAVRTVEAAHGKLDVLVNNAAITVIDGGSLRERMRAAYDTNVIGAAVMGDAFLPLLKKSSSTPRLINVSSGVGSITNRLDPTNSMYNFFGHWQYGVSKAAMNLLSACMFVEYKPDVKVFTFCPGFTVSNLGPFNTAEQGARPVAESVVGLVDVVEGKRDGEAGAFIHKDGTYPW
ncbi:hypothetical protein MBLNU457_3277t1 [Dothideomycetes sp. NU457]